MKILDGPVCDNRWVWWYVRVRDKVWVGWLDG